MDKLISLKNNEHINIVNNINNFNSPEYVYIPAKYINKSVKMNDYVYKNSYFNEYIVSISGNILGTSKMIFNKNISEVLVIKNDYKENVLNKNKKNNIKTKNELIKLLKDNYLNDIVKKIEDIEIIDNLVISSIDEEEYSVKEFIRLANNTKDILNTINLLIKIFNLNNSQIVTKNTNFKSIKNVKSIIGTYPNIKITLTPDKYLISYKNFLCSYLNLDIHNTLVLTSSDIYKIYLLISGISINDTLITISGNGIEKGMVINTRLGVSLKELINEYIKINVNDYDIYVNGVMLGYKIDITNDVIITNDIYCIVINKKEIKEEIKCINCGACNKICPVHINVKKCYQNKLSNKLCLECGLCNYICPSNIDLKKIVGSGNSEKNS